MCTHDLVVPEGTTYIPAFALKNCQSLVRAIIPESITKIGMEAFKGCQNLRTVYLPDNVATIGDSAFFGTHNLVNYTGGQGVRVFGMQVFHATGLTHFTIPLAITSVPFGMFGGSSNLETIVLHNKITHIGDFAFDYCYKLQNVVGGMGVTHYGDNSFSLHTSDASSRITHFKLSPVTESIGDNAFFDAGFNNITWGSLEVPDSVKHLGVSAFTNNWLVGHFSPPPLIDMLENGTFQGSAFSTIDLTGVGMVGSNCFSRYPFLSNDNPAPLRVFMGSHTSLGPQAFAWSGLETLEAAETLDMVPEGLCSGCSQLRAVNLPDTLIGIGAEAFKECRALTSIRLPKLLQYIGDSAFQGSGLNGTLMLPNNLEAIGFSAFRLTHLTRVVLPDDETSGSAAAQGYPMSRLRSIGESAFEDVPLLSISLPDSLTYLGASAFSGHQFTHAKIPEHRRDIGDEAFPCTADNNGATLTLEFAKDSDLKRIGSSAFVQCRFARALDLSQFSSTQLLFVDDLAFSRSTIPQVILPDTPYVFFGTEVFAYSQMASITMRRGTATMGEAMFSWVRGLTAVHIDSESVALRAFFEANLTTATVTLGDYVKVIGDSAFEGSGLRDLRVPPSVEIIGPSAFARTTVPRPTNIPLVTEYASWYSSSSGFDNDDTCSQDLEYLQGSTQFTTIAQNGFAACANLDFIQFPPSITYIGANAFTPCSTFEISIGLGVRYIAEHAFSQTHTPSGLCAQYAKRAPYDQRLTFRCQEYYNRDKPCVLRDVGSFAFKNFRGTEVALPDSVKVIGPNAFDSAMMRRFHVPKNLTSLGEQAFHNAFNLQTVEGFEDITTSRFRMGSNVFQDCSDLRTIALPSILKKLPEYTFQNCNSLARVDASTETGPERGPGVVSNVFDLRFHCSLCLVLSLTSSASLKFCHDHHWSKFAPSHTLKLQHLPPSMTVIASNAFVGCSGLFEVELPPSIKTIGPSAFGQCTALTTVKLPEFLTEMGVGAFDSADNLRSMRIPSSVVELGVGVFNNCKNLKHITFAEPAHVKLLPKNAFKGTALESIRLPPSLVEVQANAFGQCVSLRRLVVGSPDLVFDEAAFGTDTLTHDVSCERLCPDGRETISRTPAQVWNSTQGLPDSCRPISLQHAECRAKQNAGSDDNNDDDGFRLDPASWTFFMLIASALAAMASGFLLCRATILKYGTSSDALEREGEAESSRLIEIEGGIRSGGGAIDNGNDDLDGGFSCFPCRSAVEMTPINIDASMLLGPDEREEELGEEVAEADRLVVGAPKARSDSYLRHDVHVV